ncbi:MAG: hypothetical protein KAT61_10385, partial [Gammaproteobacteria bacterium]|nr:hypothetical protein [Gammaproteobacteria bacterium]
TPVFITSSKAEAGDWATIYDVIGSAYRQNFIPETAGKHGSKALWNRQADNRSYWHAVTLFLDRFKTAKGYPQKTK